MTRIVNARLAGFMFLFYIACGLTSMVLFERATSGNGVVEKLASVVRHAPEVRLTALFALLTIFAALALAVSLYALTRDTDPDLAVLALSCRIAEGTLNGIPAIALLGLLFVAAADASTAQALGGALLKLQGWTTLIGGSVFAIGSSIYSWLFLRGRSIPLALAWLGVGASVLLVIGLPLQLLRLIEGPVVFLIWIPMLVFEVTLGLWLLVKGVAVPTTV